MNKAGFHNRDPDVMVKRIRLKEKICLAQFVMADKTNVAPDAIMNP